MDSRGIRCAHRSHLVGNNNAKGTWLQPSELRTANTTQHVQHKQQQTINPCVHLSKYSYLAVLEYPGFHWQRYNSFLNLPWVLFHHRQISWKEDREEDAEDCKHHGLSRIALECTQTRAMLQTLWYVSSSKQNTAKDIMHHFKCWHIPGMRLIHA